MNNFQSFCNGESEDVNIYVLYFDYADVMSSFRMLPPMPDCFDWVITRKSYPAYINFLADNILIS